MKLLTTHICMYSDIGDHGGLFGGTLLGWLGEAGAAFACEYCGSPRMVTKRISEVVFERPLKAGRIIEIYGQIVSVGTSSLSMRIEAMGRDPRGGDEELVCKLDSVFVHVDEDGEPRALPASVHERRTRIRQAEHFLPDMSAMISRAVDRIHALPAPSVSAV